MTVQVIVELVQCLLQRELHVQVTRIRLFSEYCLRCLHTSSTKPSEMRGDSSTSNSHLHLTKSSSTSAEISTNVATKEILERQLETFRQEKAEWQQKEIVYIAIISCLVFGLIFAIAASLVCYNLPTHKPTGGLIRKRQVAC